MSRKDKLEESFKLTHPECYKDLVAKIIGIINNYEDYDLPDPNRIHEINDGDHQGTLLYVIPAFGYQPNDYWYVKINYGSCSGCDTLEAIKTYNDEPPTEEQIKSYMQLALNIVQGLKSMQGEDE